MGDWGCAHGVLFFSCEKCRTEFRKRMKEDTDTQEPVCVRETKVIKQINQETREQFSQ